MWNFERKTIKGKIVPKLTILVVYKDKNGHWRGFCSPYDVSCEGKTKQSVMNKLQALVSLYENRLKKYKYAKHLAIKPLSEPKDKEIFSFVLRKVSVDIEEKVRERFFQYQEEQAKEFKTRNPLTQGYYYQPAFL